MEHDPVDDEIQQLLRRPMGDVARGVAWQWLQRYGTEALEAVRRGTNLKEREEGVQAVRARLLANLRDVLPRIIERDRQCEQAAEEAVQQALRIYNERFDREVGVVLADPAFDHPMAEQVVRAELHTFRRQLAKETGEQITDHRRRLRESVARILEGE